MARITGVLVAALLLAATACTGSSGHRATPRASAQSSATRGVVDRHRAAEGCGHSHVYRGAPPAWATENAPELPYVISNGASAVGYLFAHPLRAVNSHSTTRDKILWYVRLPRNGHPLHIRARLRGRPGPVVHVEEPANSSPGEIYPSLVDVPTPGCWHVTLSWGPHTDAVDLQYEPVS